MTAHRTCDFTVIEEPWASYKLANGTIIRVRLVMVRIRPNGIGPDGKPLYAMDWQPVTDILYPADRAN